MPSLSEIQETARQKEIKKTEDEKAAKRKARESRMHTRKVERAIATTRARLLGQTICDAMKAHELSHDEIRLIGHILARRKDTPPDWDLLDDFPRAVVAVEHLSIKPAANEFSRTGK